MSGSSEPPLIEVKNVSKKFCRRLKPALWYGVKDMAADFLGARGDHRLELRKHEFLAVDDVSFEVRRGECVGLIGPNGAGKSTMLKMLNGLIRPDAGEIRMRGRVGALIELGTGFNPILTGRENVYINGSVLGFTKKEVDAKFDEIHEFSEIGDAIDAPVQTYSSGMKVRLGFAVASHMEPDVMLIDEVLAVGDVGFRAKCYHYLRCLAKKCAVIVVTHNVGPLWNLASRIVLLTDGSVYADTHEVGSGIAMYESSFRDADTGIAHNLGFTVHDLKALGPKSDGVSEFVMENAPEFCIDITAPESHSDYFIRAGITDGSNIRVAECIQDPKTETSLVRRGQRNNISLVIENEYLQPGHYWLSVWLHRVDDRSIQFWAHRMVEFRVTGSHGAASPVRLKASWSTFPSIDINSETVSLDKT